MRSNLVGERSHLVAKVAQARRNRFDDQVLNADFTVLPQPTDDCIRVTLERGRGIGVNRSTNPRLDSERDREVTFATNLVHRSDGLAGRFR
jgi:hypothetical protein